MKVSAETMPEPAFDHFGTKGHAPCECLQRVGMDSTTSPPSSASGSFATALGYDAEAGSGGTCVGAQSSAGGNAIAMGRGMDALANQGAFGSIGGVTRFGLGRGISAAAPDASVTVHATDAAAASNADGSNLILRGGLGDGTGTDGALQLQQTVQVVDSLELQGIVLDGAGNQGTAGQVLQAQSDGTVLWADP